MAKVSVSKPRNLLYCIARCRGLFAIDRELPALRHDDASFAGWTH
ncbi:hypothetical protein FBZ94_11421 [Bradyrhizobium sacchari]|uniref:Uncharacterized protein n=1 Tax=Bradyrhizobium sacchari TaxID=1399419 RepID=A0A560JHT3_9BRAD|nr:hypothetical protein FBZ94_11421 [Bradyrhizobium sacchari]TWB67900.1 hypothetical protein FBZ95_11321 [Bradyrhizobium sacchari]